jgi:hypothetical protein
MELDPVAPVNGVAGIGEKLNVGLALAITTEGDAVKFAILKSPLNFVLDKIIFTPVRLDGREAEKPGNASVGEVVGGVDPPL